MNTMQSAANGCFGMKQLGRQHRRPQGLRLSNRCGSVVWGCMVSALTWVSATQMISRFLERQTGQGERAE